MALISNLIVENGSFIDTPSGSKNQQLTTTIETFTSTPAGGTWTVPSGVTSVEVLVVAGGGGGGGDGGGGGAGGIVYHPNLSVTPGAAVTVTVGNGGAGAVWPNTGTTGSNSVFSSLTALGGGGGVHSGNGVNGGSGGGGGYAGASMGQTTPGSSIQTAPTGGKYWGNDGGKGGGYNSNGYPGGGGGGAGTVGYNATVYGLTDAAQGGGDGGAGIVNPIEGSTTGQLFQGKYWLGGGGGGNNRGYGGRYGRGGVGGGGDAGSSQSAGSNFGQAGTANTGGGGGAGCGSGAGNTGGTGGSGVVIVKYQTPIIIEQFTTTGQHTWTCPAGVTSVEALIVGGGGGGSADWGNGGGQGGGGGGGLLYNAAYTVTPGQTYTVIVGAGGIGGKGTTQAGIDNATSHGKPGGNSSFDGKVASGGGGGAGSGATSATQNGGSGGGGGYTGIRPGGTSTQASYAGWSAYGFAGGDHSNEPTDPGYYSGGGGGGAGGVGQKGQGGGPVGGAGGAGRVYSITGTAVYYAAGGGGGTYNSGTGGAGGTDTGGAGGSGGINPAGKGQDGRKNTGSGGGAGGGPGSSFSVGGDGGNGGTGIVVLKYTLPATVAEPVGSPAGSARFNSTSGLFEVYVNGGWLSSYDSYADGSSPDRAAMSAADIKALTGTKTSGVYWIKWNGTDPKLVWCEMDLMGGGWMMVLNYVHQGGTNPSLLTLTDRFPLLNNEYDLGQDESGSTDTFGTWGHCGNALMGQNTRWTEYMFYGKTSLHNRIIHFYGNHPLLVNYIRTGTGSMVPYYADRQFNWNGSLYNLGATASIPWFVLSDRSGYSNQGDAAMTNFPIYGNSTIGNPRAHWGVKGGGDRWEVDDYPQAQGSPNGYANNTIHRIWVR